MHNVNPIPIAKAPRTATPQTFPVDTLAPRYVTPDIADNGGILWKIDAIVCPALPTPCPMVLTNERFSGTRKPLLWIHRAGHGLKTPCRDNRIAI